MVDISVIVPTHNQLGRLKLVLLGLAHQQIGNDRYEVLVIDDASSDGTSEFLASCDWLPLRVLRNDHNKGRIAARNRGIDESNGALLVFLDGDAMPAPTLLSAYWEYFSEHQSAILVGQLYTLSGTDLIDDLEEGTLVADQDVPDVMREHARHHVEELRVTKHQVKCQFGELLKRSQPGAYPFSENARVAGDLEDYLRTDEPSVLGWIAFSPHNSALPKGVIQEERLDTEMPFFEGWDLAYRLQKRRQTRVRLVAGAQTIHLYHLHPFSTGESGWREAGKRHAAVWRMVEKHSEDRLALVLLWLGQFWGNLYLPTASQIKCLEELERAYLDLSDDEVHERLRVLTLNPILNSM